MNPRTTPLTPAEKPATGGGGPETKRSAERGGFTFNKLVELDVDSLKKVLSGTDAGTLAEALSVQNEAVRAVFLGALSKRAGDTVLDEIANLGRVKLLQVEQAENSILDVALTLHTKGEITLPGMPPAKDAVKGTGTGTEEISKPNEKELLEKNVQLSGLALKYNVLDDIGDLSAEGKTAEEIEEALVSRFPDGIKQDGRLVIIRGTREAMGVPPTAEIENFTAWKKEYLERKAEEREGKKRNSTETHDGVTAGLNLEQLDKLAWDNLAKLSPELLAKGVEGIDFRVLAVAYQDADGISFESVVKKALSPKDSDELALDELELTLPNKPQIDEARTKVVTHFREKLGAKAGNTVENPPLAGGTDVDKPLPEELAINFSQLADVAEETGVADPIEALCAERLTANEISKRLRLGDANIVRAVRVNRGIPAMTIGAGASQHPNPEFEAWLQGRERSKKEDGPETLGAHGDAKGNETISTEEKPSVNLSTELKNLSLSDFTGGFKLDTAFSDINFFHSGMSDEERKENFAKKVKEYTEVLKRELPKATAFYKAASEGVTKLLSLLVEEGSLSVGDEKQYSRFASLAEKLAKLTQEPTVDLPQFAKGADALGWFIFAVKNFDGETVTISEMSVETAEKKLMESGIEV